MLADSLKTFLSSGYGSMAEYLVLSMERAGASVNIVPLTLDLDAMSAEFQEVARRSRADVEGPALYFSWPRADLERFRRASDLFINTMWSSRLPAAGPSRSIAPAQSSSTRFVARVCADSGVTAPLEVIPEGVDPDVYHYEERPDVLA